MSYDLLGPARFKLADGDFGVGAAPRLNCKMDLQVALLCNLTANDSRRAVLGLASVRCVLPGAWDFGEFWDARERHQGTGGKGAEISKIHDPNCFGGAFSKPCLRPLGV